MRREAVRAALLGTGVHAAQADEAAWQPPLLPAPRSAAHPQDQGAPRIRELLYEQGFTISGARNRLAEQQGGARHEALVPPADDAILPGAAEHDAVQADGLADAEAPAVLPLPEVHELSLTQMRSELISIRGLLTV